MEREGLGRERGGKEGEGRGGRERERERDTGAYTRNSQEP